MWRHITLSIHLPWYLFIYAHKQLSKREVYTTPQSTNQLYYFQYANYINKHTNNTYSQIIIGEKSFLCSCCSFYLLAVSQKQLEGNIRRHFHNLTNNMCSN